MCRIRLRDLPEVPADGSNHGDRIMDRILNSFRKQADLCRRLGSPFNGFICDLLPEILDPGSRFGQRILSWPGDAESDALALRAAASFHALARSGNAAYLTDVYPPHQAFPDEIRKAIEQAIDEQDDFLHDYLDNPPQTNEVARSAPPSLAAVCSSPNRRACLWPCSNWAPAPASISASTAIASSWEKPIREEPFGEI